MALVSSSSATAVAALPSNGLAGARSSFLGAAGKAAASRASFAVRAAAPERPIWFPGSTPPPWLDGSLPGDFGFDPWGLGSDPESLRWNVQAELVHCRWAMLGAAGIFIPELLTKIGILNTPSWYTAGEQEYFTDTTTLFIVELILIGWAEGRRWADIIKPGCVNTDPIFPNNKLTGTDVGTPVVCGLTRSATAPARPRSSRSCAPRRSRTAASPCSPSWARGSRPSTPAPAPSTTSSLTSPTPATPPSSGHSPPSKGHVGS
ncbi:unnamed protein product [Triticum turgidum subsp. durum]|uniref:Chlorophyll a-b binding protein, chloroplastic n=1 Tax=Triticum turgidum subsp. durum TaxID=4567 RepID=A0A9R1PJY5_TRITD|nr:unnamed protein product [Triticum turgidum subsp. durum]